MYYTPTRYGGLPYGSPYQYALPAGMAYPGSVYSGAFNPLIPPQPVGLGMANVGLGGVPPVSGLRYIWWWAAVAAAVLLLLLLLLLLLCCVCVGGWVGVWVCGWV